MNKFIVLIASLMMFAVVAQLALAQDLHNEINDDQDVDDELEGGFRSAARAAVGLSSTDEWGWDVLDRNKGLKNLTEERAPECKKSKSKEACTTCCSGLDKSSTFNVLGVFSKSGACTCFSRDNNYTAVLP